MPLGQQKRRADWLFRVAGSVGEDGAEAHQAVAVSWLALAAGGRTERL